MHIRFLFRILLWGVCGLSSFLALAQTPSIRVSGSVLKLSDKTPLADIGVLIKGSNTGTLSDAQGHFTITIGRQDTLIFRAVGYKTIQYVPTIRTLAEHRVNIFMEEGSVALQEVEISNRPSQEKIDRYVRNIKRVTPNNTRNPAPFLRVAPDSTLTQIPTTIASPLTFMYEMFSKEGKQRQRVREMEEQQKYEDEERRRRHFNRFFKDNNGYE